MALTQDGYAFENAKHTPVTLAPKELRLIESKPFGLTGESQIIDRPAGLLLTCVLTLKNYATAAGIDAAIGNILGKRGKLTGTLYEQYPGEPASFYANATLKDVDIERPKSRDGITGNWWCQVRLRWQTTGVN